MLRLWLLTCLLLLGLPWYSASAVAPAQLPAPLMQPMVHSAHSSAAHTPASRKASATTAHLAEHTDCHTQVVPQGHCQGQMGMAAQDSGKVHCPSCLTPVAALPDLTLLGPKLAPPRNEPQLLALSRYLDHIPGVPSPPPTRSFI
ncbi:hypothetical protein [Pseudaeromonas paramecii]|uniref:DUF2946 domain-containing protein n=1 Tax=Pseudaeromonas paramecii TaxID=2138166 RepID=A0ABP8Q8D0_9GAMM